jgi:metacaspase-1
MGQSQPEGLGEEHFQEDWSTEHKRVIMFSGCRDDQTSADADIAGAHVGAMSWSFLETMRQNDEQTYLEILQNTRALLKGKYSQVPQLSLGYQMDLNQPYRI